MRKIFLGFSFLFLFVCMSGISSATTVYIGDSDGFGFPNVPSLVGANGQPADRNGNGILEPTEVLPDLNDDKTVSWNSVSNDYFDNRSSPSETNPSNSAYNTDVALMNTAADGTFFTFNFASPSVGDPGYGVTHYINFVYGDYDVYPMTATIEGQNVPLYGAPDVSGIDPTDYINYDGFIWSVYSPVAWSDMIDGQVVVEINAPDEPYVAFDYLLLDTQPINTPIPAGTWLLGSGLIGLIGIKRKLNR